MSQDIMPELRSKLAEVNALVDQLKHKVVRHSVKMSLECIEGTLEAGDTEDKLAEYLFDKGSLKHRGLKLLGTCQVPNCNERLFEINGKVCCSGCDDAI